MTTARRHPRLHIASLAWVFFGGALGAGAREGLTLLFPLNHLPWVIMGINIIGAFFLGLLLSSVPTPGEGQASRWPVRLFFGTGVLGGFTTYSALSTSTATMVAAGESGMGAVYGFGTVAIGALATIAGVAAGQRWVSARRMRRP